MSVLVYAEVFVTRLSDRVRIEEWVRAIAAHSGQKVEWQFQGLNVVIRATGDILRVKLAIVELINEHDGLLIEEYAKDPVFKFLPLQFMDLPRPVWWSEFTSPFPSSAPHRTRKACALNN